MKTAYVAADRIAPFYKGAHGVSLARQDLDPGPSSGLVNSVTSSNFLNLYCLFQPRWK